MTTTNTVNSATPTRRALLIGASRGLGLALAEEWARRGWHVTATARSSSASGLVALAEQFHGRVDVETVDVAERDTILALGRRLEGRTYDLLFVNAGVTTEPEVLVAETSTEEFTRVMVTNALGPMRVIDALEDRVAATGTIGVMSSGQGSVTNNVRGGHEVYRASKAALNTLMRSYAARARAERSLILMAPGWIKTDLGGPDGRYTIEENIPQIVDTLDAFGASPGLRYVDFRGEVVPW